MSRHFQNSTPTESQPFLPSRTLGNSSSTASMVRYIRLDPGEYDGFLLTAISPRRSLFCSAVSWTASSSSAPLSSWSLARKNSSSPVSFSSAVSALRFFPFTSFAPLFPNDFILFCLTILEAENGASGSSYFQSRSPYAVNGNHGVNNTVSATRHAIWSCISGSLMRKAFRKEPPAMAKLWAGSDMRVAAQGTQEVGKGEEDGEGFPKGRSCWAL